MKIVEPTQDRIYKVKSEPGDMPLYSYYVHRDGPDAFTFMPDRSTFRFPQRLSWWEVCGADDETIKQISARENCNPNTLMECIRTMEELHG